MRTSFRVLFSLLAAAALGGCASSERLPDARYALAERQTLPLAERLTLTYEGAEDSRCPDNARCMWAGQVAYRFTLRIGTVAQAFYLVPGKPGYTNPALRGSRIELDRGLEPPPRGMAETRPASYPVSINMYGM
ncbi:hypothetical protein B0920_13630 [Massilia sp. KIM]|uniref:hypothetical protein n=1 Tax=Massilia sp. KIM TaxID=1955422 RepID=UPI00098ED502|nr:hypothetical protein [Massilia sp. KIM]OON64321.1 hypothetical protein B0920_13630 [Massilia sp. KIM]